jgi:hypothetical protein
MALRVVSFDGLSTETKEKGDGNKDRAGVAG